MILSGVQTTSQSKLTTANQILGDRHCCEVAAAWAGEAAKNGYSGLAPSCLKQ
jgi:hypothetical protein